MFGHYSQALRSHVAGPYSMSVRYAEAFWALEFYVQGFRCLRGSPAAPHPHTTPVSSSELALMWKHQVQGVQSTVQLPFQEKDYRVQWSGLA